MQDTKDWTWVLTRPCPDCGFDATACPGPQVASELSENIGQWRALVADPLARRRPSEEVWSAVEYACHVRDVLRVVNGRLRATLEEDDPLFEKWDQERAAVEERYSEQDPATIIDELEGASAALVATLAATPDSGWTRTNRRSNGAVFTVDSLARYMLHDVIHHLWDVRQGLKRLR
jgi:hypothetical protein